jgi:integrase
VSLYKRGRTFWTYLWINGVRHAKSTGTSSRREAHDIERAFRQELNRKRHQLVEPMPDMTFGALTARFIADRPPLPYHLDRLKVLLPYFSDYPIGRISKALVRSYRTRRHAEKRLSDTTLNRDIEVLRHLLYYAVDEGLLMANPIARVPMVRERRKPRPIMGLEEEDKLLEAAAPHLHPIIIMALDTGMRRGELLTQRFEHIDLNRNVLSPKAKRARSRLPRDSSRCSRHIPTAAGSFLLVRAVRCTKSKPLGRPPSTVRESATSAFTIFATPSTPVSWKPALCPT